MNTFESNANRQIDSLQAQLQQASKENAKLKECLSEAIDEANLDKDCIGKLYTKLQQANEEIERLKAVKESEARG